MRVAVAGGTGQTGVHVVDALQRAGHTPVPLSRSAGVDLTTGTGLDEAMNGADAVVDVSNVVSQKRAVSEQFFGSVTRTLLAAEKRHGVRHHIALSIIGIDLMDTGYYSGKRLQEKLIKESDAHWTILRAAQFHEFTEQMLALVPGPVAVVPALRSQPIAVREVAAALAAFVDSGPAGAAPDLAGPTPEYQPDLARRLLRAAGRRRLVVPVRLPGAAGSAMASGAALPAGPGPRGSQTFDQWLAEKYPVKAG